MKYCNDCKACVRDALTVCPLCAAPLTQMANTDETPCAYPPAMLHRRGYSLAKRILAFLSVIAGIVSIAANILVPAHFWWALIVITGIAYAWVVIPHAMRRGGNLAGKVFTQVVFGSALVVLVDFELGWRAWSVSYVVPMILCVGITAVAVIILCNSTNWAGYVLYQVMLALFGFVPLVLVFIGLSHSFLFALITAVFALTALSGTIIFGDKSIKNEFKRRLRF